MIRSKFNLGEIFGIPVFVDISFAILLLVFVNSNHSLVAGITCAVILAVSVVLHELAHALTARMFGYHTSSITISLLGGCAALRSLPRKASQEFTTAVAGPLVSFLLAAAAFAVLCFVPIGNRWLINSLVYTMWLNVMLGGFNLLPGFPMDGGRIFRSVMRTFMTRVQATRAAMIVGRIFAVLLGLSGVHAIFTGGAWGVVRILIAWMIWQEGYREYLQAREEENFRNWTQADYNAKVSPPPYERD